MKLKKSLLIAAMALFAASGLFAKEQTKKDHVPGVVSQPAEFFYTGKPYDADLGAYTFKYRNFDPVIKRWTTTDPTGFPDGANNSIYVNNLTTICIDRFGLDVYQITNSQAVVINGVAEGHSAMIAGSGNSYTYQSYGDGSSGSGSSSGSSSNNCQPQTFTSLSAAMTYANSQGYDNYCQWNSDSSGDQAALNAMQNYANNANYNVLNHNCQDAVNAGLTAAGLDHSSSNIPNQAMSQNSNPVWNFADSAGTVRSLE